MLAADKDAINPDHYKSGDIECIDAMEAMLGLEGFRGYLRGAAFKYQWRLGMKDQCEQEIKKAEWYLDRLLQTYRKAEPVEGLKPWFESKDPFYAEGVEIQAGASKNHIGDTIVK